MKYRITETQLRDMIRRAINEAVNVNETFLVNGEGGKTVIPQLEDQPEMDGEGAMDDEIAKEIIEDNTGGVESAVEECLYSDTENVDNGYERCKGEFEYHEGNFSIFGTYDIDAHCYYESATYWNPSYGGIDFNGEITVKEVWYDAENGNQYRTPEGFEYTWEHSGKLG